MLKVALFGLSDFGRSAIIAFSELKAVFSAQVYGKELTMFVDRTESYIVSDESLLGGEPVIRGTKTPVRAIVEMWRMGMPPDEIPVHLPHITLAQVFDALRYYAEHQPEINHYIQANRVPETLVHPAVQPRKLAA
jgi:uncharacterized protein (DUF433 family)